MRTNLKKIETLAKASKVRRFLHNPGRYLYGILHRIFVYPISKKGMLVDTSTFFGTKMKVVLPAGMDLFLLGGKSHDSEIRLAKYILNTLKEGDTFLDVGAHYGYFSLLASSIVGQQGSVNSIEASKSTFSILSQNVDSQNNIAAFNIAISNRREQLDFYEFPLLYSEYNSLDADQYEKAKWAKNIKPNVIKIEAHTIDDFIKTQHIRPHFIKIDVEGVEDKVVSGMRNILKSNTMLNISMEYILDDNPKSPHEKAMRLLVDHGFDSNIITADGSLEPIAVDMVKSFLLDSNLDSDNIIFTKVQNHRY